MLASDREREATVLRLRAAHLEGRLDTDELELRIGRAHAARTRAELDAVAADVPAAPRDAPRQREPRLPGRRRFSLRKVVDAPVAEVRETLLAHTLPPLEPRGFYVHRETADAISVENRARTGSRFTIRLQPAGDRTLLTVSGAAPLSVRRALWRL